MLRHPCFDEKAHRLVGRVHLPVAPACNIKCAYCEREIGCVHESRPGVTKSILRPEHVKDYLSYVLTNEPRIEVVGIAGPGDALANEETFFALSEVRRHFPEIKICLATNGLTLPENIERLTALGLDFLSVTVNAATPETGAKLVKFVNTKEGRLQGEEGARFLLEKQLEGIALASEAGIRVKVNTVLVPGINDHEMAAIAQLAGNAGASLMNIIPLIPLGEFSGLRPPSKKEMARARSVAGRFLPQFLSCKRCRADAVGIPGLGDMTLSCLAGNF
ncbi:radical SAM protein [Thermodesulfatator atlanticus]|uniref:radical SAM protein n=1 Tax=Thermodesulfatator atlanticus TaxID=501497 RepID=UPI0003B560D8|nr:radical SAM protein [Thermodesulfatator atlanticus]